jgi:hypothetical protein
MYALFLAVVKHRMFRAVWLHKIKEFETKTGLDHIPMWTEDAKETEAYTKTPSPERHFLKCRAERALAYVTLGGSMAFFIFAVVNFFQFLGWLPLF